MLKSLWLLGWKQQQVVVFIWFYLLRKGSGRTGSWPGDMSLWAVIAAEWWSGYSVGFWANQLLVFKQADSAEKTHRLHGSGPCPELLEVRVEMKNLQQNQNPFRTRLRECNHLMEGTERSTDIANTNFSVDAPLISFWTPAVLHPVCSSLDSGITEESVSDESGRIQSRISEESPRSQEWVGNHSVCWGSAGWLITTSENYPL